MAHTIKTLPKSEIELTITVSPETYAPHLTSAAKKLSDRVAIKGFRKGHIPADILKKEVGEMAILQEALESIVQASYVDAITKEKLDVIGMPSIDIEKLAPGNDVVYRAKVALLPEVTLPKFSDISITKKDPSVNPSQVEETLDALRGMHAVEIKKEGEATGTDKLVIDMDMLIDNVPVEGGQAKGYQVYLSEDHYIPGFNEQVTGLKKDDEKKFTLGFPKTHYQKHLAGKQVDFQVKVQDVFTRELPVLDEAFAKKLGIESIEKLQELLRSNLENEAKNKSDQQVEIDMLDAAIEKTVFAEIPDVLIHSEKQKMFYELKRDLEKNGVTIEQYLQDIKKKEDELFEEFHTQALKRAKAALLSRQVAKEQNIHISPEELKGEIEKIAHTYEHNPEAQENLKRPEVMDSIATMLQNRKVLSWMKDQVTIAEKIEEKKTKQKK
ncbi:MAG: trigger factor [Candidatus Magasanikbacteria bacterium]|nr:trigger factor [Candidatus Magasanikbacteria bacterium]